MIIFVNLCQVERILLYNKFLIQATKNLFRKYDQLIFEKYIGGQEIQVAIINDNSLGAIELIPQRSFYDYKAKYTKSAKTKHVMPARLIKKKYLILYLNTIYLKHYNLYIIE